MNEMIDVLLVASALGLTFMALRMLNAMSHLTRTSFRVSHIALAALAAWRLLLAMGVDSVCFPGSDNVSMTKLVDTALLICINAVFWTDRRIHPRSVEIVPSRVKKKLV